MMKDNCNSNKIFVKFEKDVFVFRDEYIKNKSENNKKTEKAFFNYREIFVEEIDKIPSKISINIYPQQV